MRNARTLSKLVTKVIKDQNLTLLLEGELLTLNYNKVLEMLSEDEARIIKADFIDKLDKDWYITYYSRSTYYRYRLRAMDRFIKIIEST
ncbi:MAG: hypothetical protein GX760_01430 [Erysipelothrix sp.]|nr:hypothetical protein [Erysipelothrix sp.]